MRRSGAFTLVEMLTVLGVLALLAGLLFPMLARQSGKAEGVTNLSNLRQLGLAHLAYASDHDEAFALHTRQEGSRGQERVYGALGATDPAGVIPWQESIFPYVKDRRIFVNPLCAAPAESGARLAFAQASYYGVVPRAATPAWQGDTPADTAHIDVMGALTGNENAQIDGIFGAARARGVQRRLVNTVPSLTTSAVDRPAEMTLVTEAGRWEMGLGFGGPLSLGPDSAPCVAGASPGPYAGQKVYAGPFASTDVSGAYAGGKACGFEPSQTGRTSYVAVDGSAKSVDLRTGMWRLEDKGSYLGLPVHLVARLNVHAPK